LREGALEALWTVHLNWLNRQTQRTTRRLNRVKKTLGSRPVIRVDK
jgi:hypothetical protein